MAHMLKWTTGAKPGKRFKIEESTKTSKQEYEKKRTRSFQSHWRVGREWLKFENGRMYCTVCEENGDINCLWSDAQISSLKRLSRITSQSATHSQFLKFRNRFQRVTL